MIQYADHRIFTIDDLQEIRKRFKTIEAVNKIILTTEKDAVRLVKFNAEIADLAIVCDTCPASFFVWGRRQIQPACHKFYPQFQAIAEKKYYGKKK